jgi:hypothetical protein
MEGGGEAQQVIAYVFARSRKQCGKVGGGGGGGG